MINEGASAAKSTRKEAVVAFPEDTCMTSLTSAILIEKSPSLH